ncbi:MAG: TonB-dependent receptor [Dysgonamonadaceae bacterium]|jgi:hypothetical protein|nr:TonB-dependent receptor [Dysgonamonadaceae bacterium]
MSRLKRFVLFLFLVFPVSLFAQQHYEQIVRGVVLEKNTQEYLPGASVVVSSGDKKFSAITNETGEFSISGIPVGRCNISVSMVGFTSYASNNILVYSGKETVLRVVLEENVYTLNEVVVTNKVDKERPLNQLAVVSARMLSSEEANRYAGTLAGDPARMVSGFAGVIAANDTRNDIIIRGNSPTGLLWRLDGFEIPNPNHFGAMGGTGGPIGMLNNNQLANSDFYTGAFPAEFGNATSGVFDLRLRNGNNQKHEFLASIGMNGFELGAEGPLNKKTGASYMINARYSFLSLMIGLMDAMGVGDEFFAVPEYQDVCAKINLPTKHGNLSWVTLLGASRISSESDFDDPEWEWVEGERGQNMKMQNYQIFSGLNYTHRFNANTRLENRLSYQLFRQKVTIDEIEYPTMETFPDYTTVNNQEGRIAYQSILNKRIDAKNLIRGGIGADLFLTNIHNVWNDTVLNNYKGNSTLLNAFVQWQYRFSNTLSMTPGIHTQLYTLNNDYSIEPRIGFKWDATSSSSFSLGGGLFSQLQPRLVYMYEEDGVVKNKDLKMSKSWQTVLGYNQNLGSGMRLKTEVYYQSLFNVPVIPDIPEESILNFGDDFYNNWDYVFVNEGTGRNYGAEITLEKFFDKNYYFLITASLFDSKYKGYDRIERSTKFAGNYAFNALFGYEWKIGKRRLFSVNTKAAYVGGKRYIPLKVNVVGDVTYHYDYSQAYVNKLPDYFRLDLNFNMKTNYKRWSLEWFVEINNITNHKNIWGKYYNASKNKEEYIYQYGFMPNGGVRIYF